MSQQVPATRMNLTLFKTKQVAARKGYDLLKSKADALKVRFRDICKLIYDTKVGLADQSSTAFFSLTQAEYAAGNFRSKVLEGNALATVRVSSKTDNVAGVKLPVFRQYETGREISENLGLGAGGRKIQVCREKFGEYLQALIKLASLQTSFVAMDEALKITNRRVNALENVTIPRIVSTINEINRELDELEREDFTRLKVVKRKKEEAIKNEEIARKLDEMNAKSNDAMNSKLLVQQQTVESVNLSGIKISDAITMDDQETGSVEVSVSKKDKKKKKKESKEGKETPHVPSSSIPSANALAEFDNMDDSDIVFK